jgi:hypothetical protein
MSTVTLTITTTTTTTTATTTSSSRTPPVAVATDTQRTYTVLPADRDTACGQELATVHFMKRTRKAGLVWWQDTLDATRVMFDAATFNALAGFRDKGIRGKFLDRLRSTLHESDSDSDSDSDNDSDSQHSDDDHPVAVTAAAAAVAPVTTTPTTTAPTRKRKAAATTTLRDCWEQDCFSCIVASGYTEADLVDSRVRSKQLQGGGGLKDNYSSLCLLHVQVLLAWVDSKWAHATEFMSRLQDEGAEHMDADQQQAVTRRLQRDLHIVSSDALALVLDAGRCLAQQRNHSVSLAVMTATAAAAATTTLALLTPTTTTTTTTAAERPARRRIQPTYFL